MVVQATDPASELRRRRGASACFVLGLGAVSWAWSEVGFWARFRVDDSVPGWVITWLAYSVVAGVVLIVVRRFPVHRLASLVMLGSLYGWLVEGVVAATVYLALPFSIVWTGVAWHGLLTVVAGWWWLPRVLRRGGWTALGWCALVGLAWGLWSVGWWSSPPEDGQLVATPALLPYLGYVAIVSGAAALGYGLMHSCAPRPGDRRSRWGSWALIALLAAWGIATVVPAIPWAPLVLAPLVWLAWASLRRMSAGPERPGFADPDPAAAVLGWDPGVPWRRLGPLAALPAAAVAVYAALSPLAPEATGSGVFYAAFAAALVVLVTLGTVALAGSLWVAWRPRRAADAVQESG